MRFIYWSFLVAIPAMGAPLKLTPQDAMKRALEQSSQALEIRLETQASALTLAEARKSFDSTITADYGYQLSKFESATNSLFEEGRTWTQNLRLSKPFLTGTTLSLLYSGNSESSDISGSPTTDLTQDTAGLLIEQSLWRDFFGESSRSGLRSAEATYEAAQLTGHVNLQDLLVQALENYWETYVSQESFNAAMKSRDRYQKLVDSIQKKTRYGYANPADLAQAQAELEGREQKVKVESADYLQALDELKTFLKLSPDTQIEFVIPETIAAPPVSPAPLALENSRELQAAQLSLKAAEENLNTAESEASPDLKLVGQYTVQGLDENSSPARDELARGSNPRYFIGLQFEQTFGSGYQDANVTNKRLNKELSQARLDRLRLELKDEEENLKRRLESTYAIFQSAKKQQTLRERASSELSKTYTQGRTDISVLIDSLNKSYDTEALVSRSLGDYQIAWAKWLALQDRLLPKFE